MRALHAVPAAKDLKATSSLVRRLVHPNRDSAKKRICHGSVRSLILHLLQFGLTPEDIAILRRERVKLMHDRHLAKKHGRPIRAAHRR